MNRIAVSQTVLIFFRPPIARNISPRVKVKFVAISLAQIQFSVLVIGTGVTHGGKTRSRKSTRKPASTK